MDVTTRPVVSRKNAPDLPYPIALVRTWVMKSPLDEPPVKAR
jgi:hypothetical protein